MYRDNNLYCTLGIQHDTEDVGWLYVETIIKTSECYFLFFAHSLQIHIILGCADVYNELFYGLTRIRGLYLSLANNSH